MSSLVDPTDRRRFLSLTAATATVLAAPQLRAGADPHQRWRSSLIVNALGGIGNPNADGSDDNPSGLAESARKRLTVDARELADLRASGLTAVNCTMGYVAGPGDPYRRTVSEIAQYERLLQDYPSVFRKVLRAADIEQSHRDGKVGLIYGFQNTAMIDDELERIDVFADLGVRVIQLTYNPANAVGDGAMANENRGLTAFGREVVARLNDNRLMVDLSHSGEKTCLEAARVSKHPVSINHTGCRALVDLPRNKTDAELKLVADKGGFVGIYFMPFLAANGRATAEDVVAHIEHAVKICGEDAVGIGTDGTTTQIDDLDAYRAVLARMNAERRKAGVAAPGEGPDTVPFVVDLRGASQYRELAARLDTRGHTTARIEKILGGNFLRYARAVWG
ncbi:MAG: dipeptidase [Rhodanobacteraceae bacterium]